MKQPRLMNGWRIEFVGRAETDGHGVYWYMDGNKRIPLLPMFATAETPPASDGAIDRSESHL